MPYNSSLRLTEVGRTPDLHVPRVSPCSGQKKAGREPVMMDLKRKIRRLPRSSQGPDRDSLKTLLKRFVPAGGAAPYLLSPGPGALQKDFFILKRKSRRLPTFPRIGVSSARGCLTSVFGTGTGIATPPWPPAYKSRVSIRTEREKGAIRRAPRGRERGYGQGSRAISTARLCASPRLHLRPIDPVVYRGPSAGPRPEG